MLTHAHIYVITLSIHRRVIANSNACHTVLFIIYSLIDEQKYDAEIINIAGQQRMLSQRIALLSSTGAACRGSLEETYLEATLETFKVNHYRLTSLPNLPVNVKDAYFGNGQLDEHVRNYINEAQNILESPMCEKGLSLSIEQVTDLLTALDNVVNFFEQEASTRVSDVAQIEIFIWLATLLLLTIEAFVIFGLWKKQLKPLLISKLYSETRHKH